MSLDIKTLATALVVLAAMAGHALSQSTTFYPGQNEFGALMFEDLWPNEGDLDLNDVVLRYHYAVHDNGFGDVDHLELTLNLSALGSGSVCSGLALRLPPDTSTPVTATRTIEGVVDPLVVEEDANGPVIWLSDDLRTDLADGTSGFINTVSDTPLVPTSPMTVGIQFATPAPLSFDVMPFDLFLYRCGEPGHQIHQSHYYGTEVVDETLYNPWDDAPPPVGTRWYIHEDGLPYVLNIPEQVDHPDFPGLPAYPAEGVSIYEAFPEITDFVASGGTSSTDWYLHPVVKNLYAPVPEPSTVVLGALGLISLVLFTGQRRQRLV